MDLTIVGIAIVVVVVIVGITIVVIVGITIVVVVVVDATLRLNTRGSSRAEGARARRFAL